ncbi:hypothetical protein BDU57DRAFT_590883 [Ampelomyces quisqualis]|uniref:Uncharacterized protein n=1 Tax=Ampelomyces quisqualis TaxID=50730 RepID=A0A6A5Q884_AMPQU|nr:hypothetical protein BDU57DRAFT_590883 [Ampelomyces quisqualis]
MAGTRRRSRTGDAANTHRQQRSVSHAAPVVQETAAVGPEVMATSPRPDTPRSRSTKGFCKNCGSNIGEYYNSWHKVTRTYYMPALLGSYRNLLKSSGKQKAASRGPGTCGDSPIGFKVIDAPVEKKNYRNRDFFKLGRIELRCEVSPNNYIVVEPQEDIASDLATVEDSDSPSPILRPGWTEDAMEFDSRPSPSQHARPHHVLPSQQHDRHQYHQALQQVEVNRRSLPPPSRSPDALVPLKSVPANAPSNPLPPISPTVRSHTPHSAQQSPREPSVGSSTQRDFQMAPSQLRSLSEPQNLNGNTFPRPVGEVSLDAIERLQTQISQNSGELAAHTRDIRRGEESFQQLEATLRREFAAQVQHQTRDIQRVDEAVARLHLEMQGMHQALETVRHELAINRAEIQRGAVAPPSQGQSVPDTAIEMMAQQVAVMSHKTSELDNLRVTVEIMKKKIHYLEQGDRPAKPVPAPAPQLNPHAFQSSHSQRVPSVHATPASFPRSNSPIQTPSNVPTYQSFDPPSTSTLPEAAHRAQPTPNQSSGWASINVGTKRTHTAGMESPGDGAGHVPGTSKRQKVAAADPHASYVPSQIQPSEQSHEHRGSVNSERQFWAPPATLPGQNPIPESILTSQTQQSSHIPYGTQDGPSDDSWRPESQRITEHRPRGRGRGAGPGSRGGRVRKSMPARVPQLGTPDWERDDWRGVSESQIGPEGYYNHAAHSGRGIARRGSGGGGRGGHAQSERATSMGSQGVSPGFSIDSPHDPYAHTKKTRTKPIRNQDGILIRKDGRPDMRSQSSAANLRKVHARKEGEISAQGSPTGPSARAHLDQDAPSSVQRKHSAIMGKMFPSGVDELRRQNDYAHQVFEESHDHTAHPLSQNHPAYAHKAAATKIKQEQLEQSKAAEDSENEGDVDMEEHEHADVEQHRTPEEQHRTPEEQHRTPEEQHRTPEEQHRTPEEQHRTLDQHGEQSLAAPADDSHWQEPMVPETQAVDGESSATLTASTHTLQ